MSDLSNADPNKPKPRNRKALTAGAVVVVAVLAGTFLMGALGGSGTTGVLSFGSPENDAHGRAAASAEQTVADMMAMAESAGQAAAEAGAAAEAEMDATARAAATGFDEAAAAANAEIDAAGQMVGGLETAPDGYQGGNVTPGAEDHEVPAYDYSVSHNNPVDDGHYQTGNITIVDAPFEGRAAFNLPSTGNELLDAQVKGTLQVYLRLIATIKQQGNGTAAACDDDAGCVVWEHGEGRATYAGSPDGQGAALAQAHANMLINNSEAALRGVLSGIQAEAEVQADLAAEVEAEINKTLEDEAAARAAIREQKEARINATWEAAFEAEAEAHAKAERQIEATREAQVEAKQKVRAEAEQKASVIVNKSIEVSQQLEAQAEKAIEQGDQAAADIHANAAAAASAVLSAGAAAGVDASAEAEAIMSAAAQAEAQARANAKARAEALLRQSSAVRAFGEARADAVLDAAVSAEAAIDARAEVAVKTIVRAEAYTVAMIKARAKAQVDAHVRAAAMAEAGLEAKTKAHIRAVIRAAMAANAAAKVTFDGSKDFTEMVNVTTHHEVDKDVHYIREVAADYEYQRQFNQNTEAEHWENVANELDVEKEVVTNVTQEIENELVYDYWIVSNTAKDLNALGQKWM